MSQKNHKNSWSRTVKMPLVLLGCIACSYVSLKAEERKIDRVNRICYDANADYWDRFPFREHLPTMLLCGRDMELGRQVLDIGSGTGQVASFLQEHGYNVLCIDPSSEMVRRTRLKGLETVQTTLQNFQTSKRFGMICAILSLIHVPKAEIAEQITKIAEYLEPNGLFIVSFLSGETEGFEDYHNGYPRYFSRYTPEMVRNLLRDRFEELAYHDYRDGEYLLFMFQKK